MGGGASSQRKHPSADRAVELLRGLEQLRTDEPRLAEPMERMTARVIDALFWLVAAFIVLALGYGAASALGLMESATVSPVATGAVPEEMHPLASWATTGVLVAVLWGVEVPATARHGRHFAKRRLRLLVVGPEGGPPGLRRASVRWFAAWGPAFAAFTLFGATITSDWSFVFLGLELAAMLVPGAMFLDSENRGLHDRLAGTRVLAER